MKDAYYILVETSTAALALYERLREGGCRVRVAPAPRVEHACCGTSVLVPPEELPKVEAMLEAEPFDGVERIVYVEAAINPRRDKFC